MKIVINKKDLRRDTFRSGGKGGQHQNTTETGVRYTHAETGISAESRSEASQHQNDQNALKLLLAKLGRFYRERVARERSAAYQAKPDASFGAQVRTYRDTGNPRVVVDHRTGVESTFDQVVHRGKLDPFIEAQMREGV